MGQPRYIDIFAGCGGMSLGLYNAGWNGVFAIEKNQTAFETLRYNLIDRRGHFEWPSWLPIREYDINQVIKKYAQKLSSMGEKPDLVVGGPPCQGFSLAGRRKRNDQRNKAVYSYIKFIELVKPKALFFENVRGFTIGFKHGRGRSAPYSSYIEGELHKLGYNVKGDLIDFSKFGVPQRRHRFILVGLLEGDPDRFFEEIKNRKQSFLDKKDIPEDGTVENAISDLKKENGEIEAPDNHNFNMGIYSKPESKYQKFLRKGQESYFPDSHRFPRHKTSTIKKFRKIMQQAESGKAIGDELRKSLKLGKKCIVPLDGNLPSPTLTTLPDDYIHYCEPRILTVREYARIQSFPDWFKFRGKYTTGGLDRVNEVPRYSQIGNAIPPLFSELSGIVMKGMIR